MIGRLRGIILEKQPPQVMLETNGIGYEVQLPMTCFYALPKIGQEAILFTHLVMRENSQMIFGFIYKHERVLFRELIKVNGVGPKLALAILSGMSAQQFVSAVERREINALVKLPGVGKKTAERLVVEIKDRLKNLSGERLLSTSISILNEDNKNTESEAIAALVSLGYKPHEASLMVGKVASDDADCEMIIRNALRSAL
ncbi:Holliday junction ATP-dependent DNA helicase RuvA [secondary endosymbiont of Trabutina mannipara]|uniref:Holliday junction branch migration complex subunit RuvA n=1 Tax=secondary endosymbiont of Trabutina mannipara TaxID=1835721 RepID=A0A1C3L3U0_9ENTR|nr:Holliday junction branch migration protein RuvA [secondary endosymbiont of Trabutina mannipara]SBT81948.1 Holliday junction ATP-dependent DNA helicase RuvA [secondary endosymbiont of Trabutina mannipara]